MLEASLIARARETDLLRLVESDTTLVRIAGTHGGEYAGPCPFCGGTDRFHVVPAHGRWYCRQCTPRGGDAIDYLSRRQRLAFADAVRLLANAPAPAIPAPRPVGGTSQRDAIPAWMLPGWQAAAQRIVADAEQALAHPLMGAAARAYLTGRGLTPATWQSWRLGFRTT